MNTLCVLQEEELVGVLHRDTAVSNLRFLNIFYGYSPQCYAMAVNLLDRLLSRVKTHPRYLSCVATSCFYIAAKIVEDRKVGTMSFTFKTGVFLSKGCLT